MAYIVCTSVLYQKMKEIESKSNSIQHRFYLYNIPGQDCNAVCFLPVTLASSLRFKAHKASLKM